MKKLLDTMDLPGLSAINKRTDEATKTCFIDAEISEQSEQPRTCTECGAVDSLLKCGMLTRNYRDTPLHGYQVIIKLKLQRFRCRNCGRVSRSRKFGQPDKWKLCSPSA
jgi:transposase